MNRNKFPQNPVDTTTKIQEDLKAGDRIESNHPYFAGAGVVDSLPSADGAVVQLASGARQYIPLKYLRLSVASTENPGEPAVGSSLERLETISLEAISPEAILRSRNAYASDVVEFLTPDEERERHRLELRVERAFFEAGKALRELRGSVLDLLSGLVLNS